MKKALVAVAALALALGLFGCGNSITTEHDDLGDVTITLNSATGEDSTDVTVESGKVTFVSGIESGTATVALVDANGTTVAQAELTAESAYPLDMTVNPGDYTLTINAENAVGSVLFLQTPADNEAGMANPWSDVDSAAAAAQGAGIDSFEVPDQITLGEQVFMPVHFSCMDGMAQAVFGSDNAQITIRKGTQTEEPDISGDYGEYAATWNQTVNGHRVDCRGASEDAAATFIWTDQFYSYAAMYQPIEEDGSGLTAEQVEQIVSSVA